MDIAGAHVVAHVVSAVGVSMLIWLAIDVYRNGMKTRAPAPKPKKAS